MVIDIQSARPQQSGQPAHEIHILEAAAGEDHIGDACFAGGKLRRLRRHPQQRVHEFCGFAGRVGGILAHGADHGPPVETQRLTVELKGISPLLALRSRGLQQHRALALIACQGPDAEQRGSAVEEPPHAGGQGAVEPLRQHGLKHGIVRVFQPRLAPQHPGDAVQLLCGQIAAEQRDGPDRSDALIALCVARQALAAPYRPVRAEAGAVPHEADHRVFQAVVGHAGDHMRVVVLHLQQRQALTLRALAGVGGGEIVRVQIAGERRRTDIEQTLEMGDLLLVVFQRLEVFEVSDVLAGEHVVPLRQAEARLLLGPAGEHAAPPALDADRIGRIAAASPDRILLPVQAEAERVVTALQDLPVVEQEAVGDAGEPLQRLVVFVNDGRVREVGAGHHEHVDVVPEQEDMQRRIGQHHAHIAVFADMRKTRRLLFQQNDGPPPALEEPRLVLSDFADLFCAREIPAHDGKGLLVALLALSEAPRHPRVGAGAGQMHAAEALDSHDLPGFQHLAGLLQRRLVALGALPRGVDEEQVGAADRAAVRLGVVAAIFDVAVFPLAVRAHGKAPHGGQRTVIGQVPHDGKARAAVGAVDEGVAIAPVLRVQQLAPTVVAQAEVRRDERVALRLDQTRQDRKALVVLQRAAPAGLDPVDHGELRRSLRQPVQKALQRRALPLELQHHAGGAVADRAAQPVLADLTVHEGAETDALHDAVDVDAQVFQGRLRFLPKMSSNPI